MKHLWTSVVMLAVFTFLLGIVYPLAVTAFAQLAFPAQANGSMVTLNGKTAGSSLIGQMFTEAKYFHGRPSAVAYDAGNSGGSNFALTNRKLIGQITQRIAAIREEDGLAAEAPVPADLVTASASGLDPHISVDGAMIQAARVAKARNLQVEIVQKAIAENTEAPFLGIFGVPVVNVLRLNLALDTITP